ncbi:hypothetical protein [Nevskia soli]|uniref:hypothetical protein n=1 Tax=Nevskia soli TaxID=418856 RepID=UPI0012FBD5EC|nr:hypothetical protein [Nevskia soli]
MSLNEVCGCFPGFRDDLKIETGRTTRRSGKRFNAGRSNHIAISVEPANCA